MSFSHKNSREEAWSRRENRERSKADRSRLGGNEKKTAVSLLHREGTAVALSCFPAVTSWVSQRAVQRARRFGASKGSKGWLGWEETQGLKGLGRNAQGWRQSEPQLRCRRLERPKLPCPHAEESMLSSRQLLRTTLGPCWSGLD